MVPRLLSSSLLENILLSEFDVLQCPLEVPHKYVLEKEEKLKIFA